MLVINKTPSLTRCKPITHEVGHRKPYGVEKTQGVIKDRGSNRT